jgi:hypothetical protein
MYDFTESLYYNFFEKNVKDILKNHICFLLKIVDVE